MERRNLYVTYVEKEGPFLKLWGQTDKNNALYIEKFLNDVAPQFDAGLGRVAVETLPPGTLICAKYKDNKYYRAKILSSTFFREGSLEVSFIDFGNKDVVSSEAIRSLQNFPASIISIPPLALGFIFAEAHCVGGGEWNDTIFDAIAKEIKYRECICTLLAQATNYFLVRIFIEDADLCNIFVQKGVMQPISLQAQQAVLLSMSMQKSTNQPATSSVSPQINTYKACTLEPGCQYPVYVSYVNDGPCHFSVQLKQTEDVLVKLMNDINTITLRLLDDIPIPGTICLARCMEDNNICRAVVTNEVDTLFKIFYVDFGNYEILPLESLYQIPFKYVLPKVMAIRFALDGIDKSTVTMEMQVAFKKFVDNRLLHMKVLPSPMRTSLPKCELWDPETKTSALDVIIRSAKLSYPEPVALTRGFSQPVKVSFVYSCSRFYVQLVNKESELQSLMTELQEICNETENLDPSTIKEDLPCCALFSGDGLWYRSQIVEISRDTVKVRYIDFGNEECVPIDQLKAIRGEILTVLRPQAIESCLNGYQNMEPDVERDALLEELILEGVFTMKVVEMFNKKTLVDLFDTSNYNVASLLLDKLAAAKSQISPVLAVQADNKFEHRKSYSKQREQQNYNNYNKGDRNFNTGREHKSWDKPNDRNERNDKPWRQDNRENRNYDKNTNENSDKKSWRENNKGFSPNNRFDKNKKQEDSWNNTENTVNNNDAWGDNTTQKSPEASTGWKNTNSNSGQDSWNTKGGDDDWGAPPSNIDDSRPKRNDFRGGYKNDRGDRDRGDRGDRDRGDRGDRDRGDRGDRDRGDRGDRDRGDRDRDRGDRFGGGKSRDDGGGGYKKRDYRKDGSEDGSEKGYHKGGPRSSSRIDRGGRGGHNFDKPRNSYNRDNKNGGGDSWNSNAAAGDSWNSNTATEDSWNVSAVTPSIDAAPATATFTNYDLVGSEENVIISWFHNPGLFYCQQVSCQETFKTLMEEICEYYKDKKSEAVKKGAPIIALFDEDSVLYRARVVEVIGTQYKVHYVDFGNVSMVSKVYPIDKKFMILPAQAVPCALNGIAPPSAQWADPDSYSSYFDKDSFHCQFVNKDEDKTYVKIFFNSEDVAQLLVQDGLAISTESSVPAIEIPMLLGQQFRATIKSVNNLTDIILALECGMAINCSMHNFEIATETFEDTLKGLLEQAVIVYVDNILENYRLEITLYDTEGNKHIILNPDEGAYETVDVPCPMLVLQSVFSGYVSCADETSVFIQPIEHEGTVTSLLDQLFEEYDGKEHETTIIPEEEMIYAVHSEDGNWYRGKVISFDDEQATVNYIDYGNSESVSFVELRELESKFLDIMVLSLKVNIASGAEDFVDKSVTATVYYGETGWEGTVQLLDSSTSTMVAQKTEPSLDSNDTGFETSSAEKPDDLQVLSAEEGTEILESVPVVETETVSAPTELEASGKIIGTQVFMSHIDSPSDFYLQFYETLNEIESLQAELQETIPEMEDLETPVPGVLCAAPYSADQQWYRAEVLDADEDITTVRFVDFGNTDVIDNSSTKVKTLPQKFLALAIYATRCALKIQPIEKEWSSIAIKVFEELTASENLTAEFFEQDEKCTYVELYDNGIDIRQALINENFAKESTKSTEGKQTGFVSHLNSPSEFWIQLENCVEELEWIAEQLSVAESFPELEDLTPGSLCAALFPDDQMWYRARILSNTVAGLELLFIDYGNSCTSSSLRQLPEDLIITAPLALKCSLQKNEGIPTWSPEAAAKFAEISADGQTIFTVKKISTGETSVVQLLLDGQDVTTMLLPSTEEGSVKEVETLNKLTIEKESGEIVDEVALDPLEAQDFDEQSKEKFEELNEQGTTRFQIEFVNEKTVRLYLDGKDIRPLLAPFNDSSNVNCLKTAASVDSQKKIEEDSDTVGEKAEAFVGKAELPIKFEDLVDDYTPSDLEPDIKQLVTKEYNVTSIVTLIEDQVPLSDPVFELAKNEDIMSSCVSSSAKQKNEMISLTDSDSGDKNVKEQISLVDNEDNSMLIEAEETAKETLSILEKHHPAVSHEGPMEECISSDSDSPEFSIEEMEKLVVKEYNLTMDFIEKHSNIEAHLKTDDVDNRDSDLQTDNIENYITDKHSNDTIKESVPTEDIDIIKNVSIPSYILRDVESEIKVLDVTAASIDSQKEDQVPLSDPVFELAKDEDILSSFVSSSDKQKNEMVSLTNSNTSDKNVKEQISSVANEDNSMLIKAEETAKKTPSILEKYYLAVSHVGPMEECISSDSDSPKFSIEEQEKVVVKEYILTGITPMDFIEKHSNNEAHLKTDDVDNRDSDLQTDNKHSDDTIKESVPSEDIKNVSIQSYILSDVESETKELGASAASIDSQNKIGKDSDTVGEKAETLVGKIDLPIKFEDLVDDYIPSDSDPEIKQLVTKESFVTLIEDQVPLSNPMFELAKDEDIISSCVSSSAKQKNEMVSQTDSDSSDKNVKEQISLVDNANNSMLIKAEETAKETLSILEKYYLAVSHVGPMEECISSDSDSQKFSIEEQEKVVVKEFILTGITPMDFIGKHSNNEAHLKTDDVNNRDSDLQTDNIENYITDKHSNDTNNESVPTEDIKNVSIQSYILRDVESETKVLDATAASIDSQKEDQVPLSDPVFELAKDEDMSSCVSSSAKQKNEMVSQTDSDSSDKNVKEQISLVDNADNSMLIKAEETAKKTLSILEKYYLAVSHVGLMEECISSDSDSPKFSIEEQEKVVVKEYILTGITPMDFIGKHSNNEAHLKTDDVDNRDSDLHTDNKHSDDTIKESVPAEDIKNVSIQSYILRDVESETKELDAIGCTSVNVSADLPIKFEGLVDDYIPSDSEPDIKQLVTLIEDQVTLSDPVFELAKDEDIMSSCVSSSDKQKNEMVSQTDSDSSDKNVKEQISSVANEDNSMLIEDKDTAKEILSILEKHHPAVSHEGPMEECTSSDTDSPEFSIEEMEKLVVKEYNLTGISPMDFIGKHSNNEAHLKTDNANNRDSDLQTDNTENYNTDKHSNDTIKESVPSEDIKNVSIQSYILSDVKSETKELDAIGSTSVNVSGEKAIKEYGSQNEIAIEKTEEEQVTTGITECLSTEDISLEESDFDLEDTLSCSGDETSNENIKEIKPKEHEKIVEIILLPRDIKDLSSPSDKKVHTSDLKANYNVQFTPILEEHEPLSEEGSFTNSSDLIEEILREEQATSEVFADMKLSPFEKETQLPLVPEVTEQDPLKDNVSSIKVEETAASVCAEDQLNLKDGQIPLKQAQLRTTKTSDSENQSNDTV